MPFEDLKTSLKQLGLELNESEPTVEFESVDVEKMFEGTGKSNTIRYTLDGEELDKMDSATMALMYAKFSGSFDEPNTFITKSVLDQIKKHYKCAEPYTKKCIVRFLRHFSKKLKMNLFLIPRIHSKRKAFKFMHDGIMETKYIYFDFKKLMALNIPATDLPISVGYLKTIHEWTNEEDLIRNKPMETRRSKMIQNSTKKRSVEDSLESEELDAEDAEESKEAEERDAEESKEAEERDAEESKEAEEQDAEESKEAEEQDAEESKEAEEQDADESNEALVRPVKADSRTRKAVSSEELKMYNEIIDGVTPGDPEKLSNYVRTQLTDGVMLTPKQAELIKYPEKSARTRYKEVKQKNIFNAIVPAYLAKCNLAMKRHGLQVIDINPHMCQLIMKLGFGDVDEKKLRLLRTYSTSVQLRTALQLRNLLAQIILKHKNTREMETDSVCVIDADFIHSVLAEEQQTALLGVHRDKTDVVTSLITFRPSSTDDRLVDQPELTDLWAARKLAFLDIGCAPSEQTLNKLLKKRPAHSELLLYYALLNIIAASAKRARKYSGVCATLEPGSVLEAPLQGLGFKKYEWASQPRTVTYALYGDETLVDLIDAVDKKIDAVTSPYISEICKGGVCK